MTFHNLDDIIGAIPADIAGQGQPALIHDGAVQEWAWENAHLYVTADPAGFDNLRRFAEHGATLSNALATAGVATPNILGHDLGGETGWVAVSAGGDKPAASAPDERLITPIIPLVVAALAGAPGQAEPVYRLDAVAGQTEQRLAASGLKQADRLIADLREARSIETDKPSWVHGRLSPLTISTVASSVFVDGWTDLGYGDPAADLAAIALSMPAEDRAAAGEYGELLGVDLGEATLARMAGWTAYHIATLLAGTEAERARAIDVAERL